MVGGIINCNGTIVSIFYLLKVVSGYTYFKCTKMGGRNAPPLRSGGRTMMGGIINYKSFYEENITRSK